jgi:hypothetical protein
VKTFPELFTQFLNFSEVFAIGVSVKIGTIVCSIRMVRRALNRAVIFSRKRILVSLCLCLIFVSPLAADEGPPLEIGAPIDSLKTSELRDSFNEIRNGHRHEAIDIMRPRGTPVRAVIDGIIRKIFISGDGGLTIYEFDREGAYCFYYAHLDHYADNLREGMAVARGDVIGYVGTTGDAAPDAPQLHFAIFKLGPDKSWWKGEAIDPYPFLLRAASEARSAARFQTGTGFAYAKLSEIRSSCR